MLNIQRINIVRSLKKYDNDPLKCEYQYTGSISYVNESKDELSINLDNDLSVSILRLILLRIGKLFNDKVITLNQSITEQIGKDNK